jgi:hypothetical protein
MPPQHDVPDDARDERLAAQLAVPPLDEVTRRRLVRTAVDTAMPGRRRGRWVAAASVAALMLGGVVAAGLALDDGGGEPPTAARTTTTAPGTTVPGAAPSETRAEPTDRPAGSKRTRETEAAPAPPVLSTGVPDLGDVSDPDTLATRARDRGAAGDADAATEAVSVPCAAALAGDGLGDVELIGTGTRAGAPVYVLVGVDDDTGASIAATVDPASCEVRSRVPL